MSENRSQRMQVVLLLADRKENESAQRLNQFQIQVAAEEEQLRQLDEYAKQYLHIYAERKEAVRADELIAYSGFIQRLATARKDQELRLESFYHTRDKLQQQWRENHHKRNSIEELIARLKIEENNQLEKRLQKEMDDIVSQQYARNQPVND